MIALRRAALIRDWYPDPCALKNSKISASILKDVRTFVGVACGPRPRFRTGAPNMFSVHAGLSGSSTLAEVFFGNLAVVVCFMFFCLSERDYVRTLRALGVNQNNHISRKNSKANQAFFAVILPFIFASYCEVVPDCIASSEVKPMLIEVQLALWLIPCERIKLYLQNNQGVWACMNAPTMFVTNLGSVKY